MLEMSNSIDLAFQNYNFDFFYLGFNRQLCHYSIEKSWISILASESWQSKEGKGNVLILMFPDYQIRISQTVGLTASINVLIDSSLSIEGFSKWKFWDFVKRPNYHLRLKMLNSAIVINLSIFNLIMFQSCRLEFFRQGDNWQLRSIKKFCEFICCWFDQSFLHPVDVK